MLLFVYGTLKQGGKYHQYLTNASLVAERAVAEGALYDTGFGYPAMILSAFDETEGEVYEVPDELWPAIDELEGYSGGTETDLYDKITISVRAKDECLPTIVYVAKDERLLKKKIDSGSWDVTRS